MWLFDLLQDILPSCLKPSKKIISSSPTNTDGNNVSTTDNSKPNSTDAKMKKCKTNTNKLDNNVENENFYATNTINDLNVSMIGKNNDEDIFIEQDDAEKENSFFKWIIEKDDKKEQNTNCNNDGELTLNLNNTSLNNAINVN